MRTTQLNPIKNLLHCAHVVAIIHNNSLMHHFWGLNHHQAFTEVHFCLRHVPTAWLTCCGIDNLKGHSGHQKCSVTSPEHLFLSDSPTYVAFFWCYPDKTPAAVSVTSQSQSEPSCFPVTAHTILSSHNTDACVWEDWLPISAEVSEAEDPNLMLILWNPLNISVTLGNLMKFSF